MVDGFNKPDYAYLKQVVWVFAAVLKALNNRQHKPEIALYHFVARELCLGFAAVSDGFEQLDFFFFAEDFQLRCVYSAYFYLVVLQKNSPFNNTLLRVLPKGAVKFKYYTIEL